MPKIPRRPQRSSQYLDQSRGSRLVVAVAVLGALVGFALFFGGRTWHKQLTTHYETTKAYHSLLVTGEQQRFERYWRGDGGHKLPVHDESIYSVQKDLDLAKQQLLDYGPVANHFRRSGLAIGGLSAVTLLIGLATARGPRSDASRPPAET